MNALLIGVVLFEFVGEMVVIKGKEKTLSIWEKDDCFG